MVKSQNLPKSLGIHHDSSSEFTQIFTKSWGGSESALKHLNIKVLLTSWIQGVIRSQEIDVTPSVFPIQTILKIKVLLSQFLGEFCFL